MKKKDSIENVARIIVNRVKYHAPVMLDGEIDLRILENFGIDTSLPLFVFGNELSKPLLKAFSLAKKRIDFNFVTTKKSKCPFALYLPEKSVSFELLDAIKKLDINYKTNSLYIPHSENDYIKIGGKELELEYNNFSLEKHANIDGVLVSQRTIYASGNFTVIELCNSNKNATEIEIAYNKNLKHGYYVFNRHFGSLEIKNLYSQKCSYLNTNCDIKNIFFSCVDGVESSTNACIKFSQKIRLKPYHKKYIYFHFGDEKFVINSFDEIERIFDLSLKKCYKNFDVKIATLNKDFDEKFNNLFPKKIWLGWLSGKRDIEVEKEYIEDKEKILLRDKNKIFFNGNYNNFKRIFVFDGEEYRQIKVDNLAKENAIVVGKTSFVNSKTLHLDKIKSYLQICLQFK